MKKDQERKTKTLRIRMTGDDRSLMDLAAQFEGLDTSTWARKTLVRSAKRKKIKDTMATGKWKYR